MKRVAQRGSDRAGLIPKLPSCRGPQSGDKVPNDLIGATILGIGTREKRQSGLLLVIDYKTRSGHPRRLELASNDIAMWQGPIRPNQDDAPESVRAGT